MSTFALTSASDILDAVNYAVSNLGQAGLQVNTATGEITAPGDSTPVAYLYRWMAVRYADNNTGSENFSTSPTGRLYYGLRNSDSANTSENPTDYVWFQATGGFDTFRYLYYSTTGGRQVRFAVASVSPGADWATTPQVVPFDLDELTTTGQTGPQGPQGPQGEPGPQGNVGPQGPQGYSTGRFYYFNYDTTEVAGLRGLEEDPLSAPERITTVSALASTNTLIDTYISDPFDFTTITGGVQQFQLSVAVPQGSDIDVFCRLKLAANDGTVIATVGDTSPSPVLFVSSGMPDLVRTTITLPTTSVSEGQRMLVEIWAMNNDAQARSVSFYTQGAANYSFVITSLAAAPGPQGPPGPQGNVGPQGPAGASVRGPTALAYVLTTGDPAAANTETLTQWFQASRSATEPPIGFGVPPIEGDAAQFYYTSGNTGQVLQFTANVWEPVTAQVISGGLVVPGTIRTNQLASDSVTADKILANTITGDRIAFATITGDRILANTITGDRIAAGTIQGDRIAANTITGDRILASTITGNRVAASTITGDRLVALTITGDRIAASTITADKFAANALIANTVRSDSATLGDFNSPGFWMQGSTGNARFGGNVSIGNTLTINGLVNNGQLIANTVATINMLPATVTQAVVVNPDYPGPYPVPRLNDFTLWPDNTRGIATSTGATIRTTSTGDPQGSRIQINYGTSITANTNPASNLVELWRTGTSNYYQYSFNDVGFYGWRDPPGGIGQANLFTCVGENGTYAYSGDDGLTFVTGQYQNFFETFNTVSVVQGYDTSQPDGTGWIGALAGNNADLYYVGQNAGGGFVISTVGTVNDPRVLGFNVNGSVNLLRSTNIASQAFGPRPDCVFVGDGGRIARVRKNDGPGVTVFPAAGISGFVNSLESVAADRHPSNPSGTDMALVTVGSSGSLLRTEYDITGNVVTGGTWSQISTGVIDNLWDVWCAYPLLSATTTTATVGTTWIAVGDNGTILRGTSGGSTWQQRSTPTQQNLRGITGWQYVSGSTTFGTWIAVGDNNTLIYSNDDGLTWSLGSLPAPGDGSLRQLRAITVSDGGTVVITGENIIYRTKFTAAGSGFSYSNPVWTKPFDSSPQVTSSLQRLAYWGSWGNISTTTTPPAEQQIGDQTISGVYYDTDYTQGQVLTYYLVVGSLANAAITVNQPSLALQELKR